MKTTQRHSGYVFNRNLCFIAKLEYKSKKWIPAEKHTGMSAS